MLKVLVPFKRVQDVASGASLMSSQESPWIINPFDQIALEEAVRMKERGDAAEVAAVTIAPAAADEQIRAALAMGVDRAVRVDDSRELDPYAVARILMPVVKREMPDLVIMGKQAVDDDANQVGQMLAGLLNWPQATFVSRIEFLDNRRLQCTRETDAGLEVLRLKLPAVLTTDLRLNEPRYVSLPGLMKARRRTIELLTCEQLAVRVEPRTTVLASAPAPRRCPGTRVESIDDLFVRLRQQEKML
jgi:electron transfer flavoprotein beta subunit